MLPENVVWADSETCDVAPRLAQARGEASGHRISRDADDRRCGRSLEADEQLVGRRYDHIRLTPGHLLRQRDIVFYASRGGPQLDDHGLSLDVAKPPQLGDERLVGRALGNFATVRGAMPTNATRYLLTACCASAATGRPANVPSANPQRNVRRLITQSPDLPAAG